MPIGLVAADWGGEPIEPFMSPDALADKTCGGTKPKTVAAAAVAAPSSSDVAAASGSGSNIWNGMIAPLAKMKFSSVIWYQVPFPHSVDRMSVALQLGQGTTVPTAAKYPDNKMLFMAGRVKLPGPGPVRMQVRPSAWCAVMEHASSEHASSEHASSDTCSFPAMIHDWRAKFESPQLPFYFVQLAPCYGHKDCGDFVGKQHPRHP